MPSRLYLELKQNWCARLPYGAIVAALLLAANPSLSQEVVVGRDANGKISIQATRYDGAVNIDGNLDEAVYRELTPISDFVQQIPVEGAAASERTEAWVFFDDDNLYVAARNYE